jgi:hypothetical protein
MIIPKKVYHPNSSLQYSRMLVLKPSHAAGWFQKPGESLLGMSICGRRCGKYGRKKLTYDSKFVTFLFATPKPEALEGKTVL